MFTNVSPPIEADAEHRMITVDTTSIPDFIHYMHVVALDKGGDRYSDDQHIVQVKITQYDVDRFPNLRDVDHIFLVYRSRG